MKKYIAFPKTTDHSSSTSVSALLPHRTISGVIHHRLVRGSGHGAVGGDVVVDEHRCRGVGRWGGGHGPPDFPGLKKRGVGTGARRGSPFPYFSRSDGVIICFSDFCPSGYSNLPTALTEASQGGSELDQGCLVGQKVWLKVRFLKGPRRFYKVSYTKVEIQGRRNVF